MTRSLNFASVLFIVLWGLCGCAPEQTEQSAVTSPVDPEEHAAAIADWEQRVIESYPASEYVTNEFIPPPDATLASLPSPETTSLRVGLPWIFNDEAAPWLLAKNRGYFAEAGLEIELVAGGPAKDHLLTLAGGTVEIALINDGSRLVKYLFSPTPIDALLVSTILQRSPGILLTIDETTPQDARSTRIYTPQDLIGKTIGVTAESEFHVDGVLDRAGIPRSAVTLRRAGNEPTLLTAGAADYMSTWIVNQPRLLEAAGYRNWNGLRYDTYLFRDYADATVVRKSWAKANRGTLLRFHWAVRRAVEDMLKDPKQAAREVASALDGLLTTEQILWRFEQQASLIHPSPEDPLLIVDPSVLDHIAAYLAHYGTISLP
jgi:ABC-type nitrate/sulfonate/bicarbonate transport system substrate-binding protein